MQAIECSTPSTPGTRGAVCLTTTDSRTLCGDTVASTLPPPAGTPACTMCAGAAARQNLVVVK